MSHDPIEEERPCIRGCTWEPATEGEEPRPKPAKHGNQLCDSCFYRIRYALKAVPDLIANMRLKIVPSGAQDYQADRVQGGRDGSPAPLRVEPLDASDALFAKLVLWIDNLSEALHMAAPSIRVWMGMSEVQGYRPVSAKAAHDQASQLTSWLLIRLEQISGSGMAETFHDDICWGWGDSPGVYKLTGQYGIEPRPSKNHECPVCGRKEVFVAWPSSLNPDIMILCGRCKWTAEPEKYGHYAELFKSA